MLVHAGEYGYIRSDIHIKCDKIKVLESTGISDLNHNRILPFDFKSAKFLDKLVYCSIRPDKLVEFSCKTCEQPLCMICTVISHKERETENVPDAIKRLKASLTKYSSIVNDKLKIIQLQGHTIN
jgi:hypothetical protein